MTVKFTHLHKRVAQKALMPDEREILTSSEKILGVAKRVAHRAYQKHADVFEAPPRLVEAVTNFVIPTWAGWCLTNINHRIEALQTDLESETTSQKETDLVEAIRLRKHLQKYTRAPQKREGTSQKIKVDLDGWKYMDNYAEDIRKILGSQLKKIKEGEKLAKDIIFSEELPDPPNRYHIVSVPYLKLVRDGTLVWRYSVGEVFLNRPGKDVFFTRVETDSFEPEFTTTARSPETTGAPSEVYRDFHEQVIQPALRSQMKSMNAYKDDKKLAQQILKGNYFDEIKVKMNPFRSPNAVGSWSSPSRTITMFCPDLPENVKYFETLRRRYTKTVRHECQHAGQNLLKVLKNLNEIAGQGDRATRNPEYDTTGRKLNERGKGQGEQRPHALREVEFQTRLRDEIDRFDRKKRELPKRLHAVAAHLWTGSKTWSDLYEEDEDGRKRMPLDSLDVKRLNKAISSNKYGGSHFFGKLKMQEPRRWRKAVKEFVEQIL